MNEPPSQFSQKSRSIQLMSTGRLEAFSDGVLAIAITLLVQEIKVPALPEPSAATLSAALLHRWPLLVSTVLSFIAIGCYWVNHHALLRALRGADHGFVLLTLLWLLALCLIPFPTALLGETMLHGDSI